jgi:hypothetical protein
MPWINRIIALSLMGGVIPLWRTADRFPGMGAAFPRVALTAVAALAAAVLARSFLPARVRLMETEGTRNPRGIVRPVVGFAAGLGGVYLMRYLGFFPAMIVFAAVLLPVLRAENRRIYLTTIVVVLIGIYLVFVLLLGVPLTAGRMA